MTRTEIHYAWREIAPSDDESIVDAILELAERINATDQRFIRISQSDFRDIKSALRAASEDADRSQGYAEDAKLDAERALRTLLDASE